MIAFCFATVPLPSQWSFNSNVKSSNGAELKESKNNEMKEEKEMESKHESHHQTTNFGQGSSGSKSSSFIEKLFAIKKEKSLTNDERINRMLLNDLQKKSKSDRKYIEMYRTRESLPAFSVSKKIIELVNKNQVVVLSGETGCGKSTQIPQFILDDYIYSKKGSLCNIVVTQPRRISAIGLAERVSQERSEKLGQTVGYSIRLENKMSDNTRLLYCTTGILLRRLMSSLSIDNISHVIIDEVHERSVDIDFLLVILKDLLRKRKDLKLILMSATLNAQLFSKYFGNAPVLTIAGRTFPVKCLYLEDLLSESRIYLEKPKWSKYHKMDQQLRFKEIQQWTNNKYPDRICHQLAKWDERENHQIEIDLVVDTIIHIDTRYSFENNNNNSNQSRKQNAILVFLPGMYEIVRIKDKLTEKLNEKQMNVNNWWIIALHSQLPTTNQKMVFDTAPYGIRKVVLSTNIAETSVTINDVKFVIDCGKMREMTYDATKKLEILSEVWIARAHGKQRQGRAGRVGPGICYKLYTSFKDSNDMLENPIPEIMRSSLENVCLTIKLLRTIGKGKKYGKKDSDVGAIAKILGGCIEAPPLAIINASIEELKMIGALDEKEMLTPLGFHLAKLPVGNVRLGKMLIYSCIFRCVTPVLIIASILTCKSFFVAPMGMREEADKLKKQWYIHKSDHIMAYRAFKQWKTVRVRHGFRASKDFAWHNFLNFTILEQIDGIIKQYSGALKEIQFLDRKYNFNFSVCNKYDTSNKESMDYNSNSMNIIKSMIVAGLYPNVIRVRLPKKKYEKVYAGAQEIEPDSDMLRFYLDPKWAQFEKDLQKQREIENAKYGKDSSQSSASFNTQFESKKNNEQKNDNINNRGSQQGGPLRRQAHNRVFLHGTCQLKNETGFSVPWLVYLTKMETFKIFIYDATMVTAYSLLLFGGDIKVDHENSHIVIDDWIRFIAPARTAVLVKELRNLLDFLILTKIGNPSLDLSDSGTVQAIERLLKSDGLEKK